MYWMEKLYTHELADKEYVLIMLDWKFNITELDFVDLSLTKSYPYPYLTNDLAGKI